MINFDPIKDAPLRYVAERFAAFAIANAITVEPRVYAGDFTPVPGYQEQYHLAYARSTGDEWVFDVNVAITESIESNDWKIRSLREFFGLLAPPLISFSEFIHAPQAGPRDVDGKTPIIVSTAVAASPIGKEFAPGLFAIMDDRQEGEVWVDPKTHSVYQCVAFGMFTRLWKLLS